MPATLWQTYRKETWNIPFILFSLAIAGAYLASSAYLLNSRLINDTIIGNHSFNYKITLLWELMLGSWTSYTHVEFFFLILNAILVGCNTVLIMKSMKRLKDEGAIQLSVGGATLLGFVTAGCSSCGLSVLSLLGVSTTFSSLPFKGVELHVIATITLLFSFIYMLYQLDKKAACEIN